MPKKQCKAPAPLIARQGTAVCALAVLGYFLCLGLIELAMTFFPTVLSLGPEPGWHETARLFFWNALPSAAFLPPFFWAAHTLRPGVARLGLRPPRAGLPRGFAPAFLGLSMLASTAACCPRSACDLPGPAGQYRPPLFRPGGAWISGAV